MNEQLEYESMYLILQIHFHSMHLPVSYQSNQITYIYLIDNGNVLLVDGSNTNYFSGLSTFI